MNRRQVPGAKDSQVCSLFYVAPSCLQRNYDKTDFVFQTSLGPPISRGSKSCCKKRENADNWGREKYLTAIHNEGFKNLGVKL